MDQKQLAELTPDIVQAAEAAGDFIRSQVGRVHAHEIEAKERNSLVSYVDKKAEEMLVGLLSELVPSPGFLTEEDTIDNTRSEFTWIIDPLDGTTNFLQQIPIFSVSVALAHHDEVIAGCVVDIMQEDTYFAWRGGGAWCGGKRLAVSTKKDLGEAIIATGFPYYSPDNLHRLVMVLETMLTRTRGIRRLGSAALDMTYVASGKMDGFYEMTLNPWDIAAGTILVREAGGIVTDFNGGGEFAKQGQVVASNKVLHTELLEILNLRVGV